jgi:hypothetical protein
LSARRTVVAAVEADGVDSNRARLAALVLASLALLRLESNAGRASTLSVLDSVATLSAAVGLLADRTVGHLVVGVNVSVPRRADLVAVDGHLVLAITLDLRVLVDVSSDALVLECTLGNAITLAERVATLEARKFVAAVGAE